MKQFLLAAVIGLGLGAFEASASSAPVVYDCKMTSSERYGIIPPRVIISYHRATKTAHVYGPIINSVHGHPIEAEFRDLGKSRVRLKWRVANVPARGAEVLTLTFDGRFDESSRKLRLSGEVSGYDNRPYGTGTCVPSTTQLAP
ncbi:MAG: hypothetical protein OIF47_16145 [Marinibacterium sp.]|nr:hypothetical protein [Marinibacterium sp.]